MKFNEYPELTSLSDNDLILVQESTTSAIKKIKLSTLKQYVGGGNVSTSEPVTGYSKWFRMDSVTSTGTTITSIIDKAGGNNLTPITGNPTLLTNAFNGRNIANFNNYAMKHNAQTYIAKHVFIVYRNNIANYSDYNAYIAARVQFSDKLPASNEIFIISGSINKPNIYGESATKGFIDTVEQNINAFKDYNVGVNAGTLDQFHIVESVFGNSVSGTKNLCVGADNNSSGRYLQNTDMAEILIYPFELSTQQKSTMYAYFKSYYSFTSF